MRWVTTRSECFLALLRPGLQNGIQRGPGFNTNMKLAWKLGLKLFFSDLFDRAENWPSRASTGGLGICSAYGPTWTLQYGARSAGVLSTV